MMFLVGKIFFYLFLAGAIGAVSGWLMRNLQGQRSEESASRAAHDAKSKLPQMESLLRGRDEQIARLKAQLGELTAEAKEHAREVRALEDELQAKQSELSKALEAQAGSVQHNPLIDTAGEDGQSAAEIALLQTEVDQLRAQLQTESRLAGENASSDLARELNDLRAQLENESERVRDLERERDLQANSLQALNQQLELARNRQVANG